MITYEYLNSRDYHPFTYRAERLKHDPEDINRLWGQLSTKPRIIELKTVMLMASSSNVLVARDEHGRIQAMATLCVMPPTFHGTFGFIEDVIVDESLRGQHVGETLITRFIVLAIELDVHYLKLTSKPSRVAANALYQKLGFQLQSDDTNHYTLSL